MLSWRGAKARGTGIGRFVLIKLLLDDAGIVRGASSETEVSQEDV
jgi:hypothetical protein